MSEDKDATITVLQLLSRYLLDHPLASDTPDGIASWWLRLDWATHASAIESALRRLIDLGSIEEIGGPDGRVRYRRVPGALADAALADLAAPGWLQPGGNGSSTH